ncbi:S-layer homology domain-containing protein [Fusibacter tunisiensis]|uniref:SLH domain-containing protein n=1 Tax=Fusibacter tunisiensis TaxID=1008308 RepID=A0ABS2MPT0_9FIRM|nr:S-layer homology domain-containing protein [Fusibacter tunisiensis]MBM7561414.1 hypothetical protein [Fusibacter tunisiensis]
MNKILIAVIILVFVSAVPVFAGEVETLEVAYNATAGEVTVQGTASTLEKGVLVIEILDPSGSLLYFGTTSVDILNAFQLSVEVGDLRSGVYTVRCADYTGGTYTSQTFTVSRPVVEVDDGVVDQEFVGPTVSKTEDEATINLIASEDENGVEKVSVADDLIEEMLKSNPKDIVVKIKTLTGSSGELMVDFSGDALEQMLDAEIEHLTIETDFGSMEVDLDLFRNMDEQSGDLQIRMTQVLSNELTDAQRQVVGNRPVIDFAIFRGEENITDFSIPVQVKVPYTLANFENQNQVVVYYITDGGELKIVPNGYFDSETKTVQFETNHFSSFALGYNPIVFEDVPVFAWYAEAVDFTSAREIVKGIGLNQFDPHGRLTRGQFITMLMRTYGVQPSASTDNFTDAGDTFYTGYLAAAKELGLTNGVGENRFEPERLITREEMFTLIYKAISRFGLLEVSGSDQALEVFEDYKNVSDWAQKAISDLTEMGLVEGNEKGQLQPFGEASRAEMVALIQRILKR